MRANPQTMMRTALAVVFLVGCIVIQQPWDGPESAPDAKPRSATRTIPSVAAVEMPEVKADLAAATKHDGSVSLSAIPQTVATAQGDFDFYVLSLSWSPTHCASDAGGGRDDDMQCRSGRSYGFVLHGLWPQFERGYPENCASDEPRRVSADIVADALKLTPSERLVQHEWKKHGTCSGLTQDDYFASAALAVESVRIPKSFKQPEHLVQTTANEVRRAFLGANPALHQSGILVTCRRNEIAEVRVCLDKELTPRACSKDSLKSHCGARSSRMLAVRGNWPRN